MQACRVGVGQADGKRRHRVSAVDSAASPWFLPIAHRSRPSARRLQTRDVSFWLRHLDIRWIRPLARRYCLDVSCASYSAAGLLPRSRTRVQGTLSSRRFATALAAASPYPGRAIVARQSHGRPLLPFATPRNGAFATSDEPFAVVAFLLKQAAQQPQPRRPWPVRLTPAPSPRPSHLCSLNFSHVHSSFGLSSWKPLCRVTWPSRQQRFCSLGIAARKRNTLRGATPESFECDGSITPTDSESPQQGCQPRRA